MLSARFGLGYWGVLLVVFMIPWENMVVLPGLGTVTRISGAVAVALGLLHVVIFGRIRLPRAFVTILLFVLFAGFSMFWSVDPEGTASRATTYAQLAILAFLIVNFAATWDQARGLLLAYIAGCVVSALYTIQAYSTGQAVVYQRYGAEGFDVNDLAMTIGIGMAFCLAFLSEARSLLRVLAVGAMALLAAAILLTASRAGFLGLAAVVSLTLLLVLGRNATTSVTTRVSIVTACLLATAYALTLVPQTSWDRIETIPEALTESNATSRYAIWHAYAALIAEAPGVGYGAGASKAALGTSSGFAHAAHHNVFLAVVSDLGLVGGALFAVILVVTVVQLRRLPAAERIMWAAALLVLFGAMMSLSWEVRKPLWLVLSLVMARATEQASVAPSPGPDARRAVPKWLTTASARSR